MKLLPQNSRVRRYMIRITKIIFAPCIACYFLLLFLLYLNQRELVFHPHAAHSDVDMVTPLTPGSESLTLTTDHGGKIKALFGSALLPDGRLAPAIHHRATLLFFYGNGGSIENSSDIFESLRRLGVNVLIPDYVGFGSSQSDASDKGCYATADAAFQYLLARSDIDHSRIVICGYSLGTAVAIDLAKRKIAAHYQIAGLAIFSGFTSMAEMAHSQYPIFPTTVLNALLKYPFPSEQNIKNVTCPILIGHSLSDQLVPYAMSGRLAAAAGGPVTRLTINHAMHGEFFAVGGNKVYSAIGHFLAKLRVEKERHNPSRNTLAKLSQGDQNYVRSHSRSIKERSALD